MLLTSPLASFFLKTVTERRKFSSPHATFLVRPRSLDPKGFAPFEIDCSLESDSVVVTELLELHITIGLEPLVADHLNP